MQALTAAQRLEEPNKPSSNHADAVPKSDITILRNVKIDRVAQGSMPAVALPPLSS